jgi:transaldolase/glucose-6-phosphate isomerase
VNAHLTRLPAELQAEVDEAIQRAAGEGWARRLWARDASLWTGQDEARWLRWLDAGDAGCVDLVALKAFQAEVKAASFAHVLLIGMGGSSLGPEVLAQTFGAQAGFPQLLVLDSTDADQIRRFEAQIDPSSTLFVVSSKSGTTLEPDILQRHFWALAKAALGEAAGGHFVAVTDPGSKLEAVANQEGFRRVFHGEPQIGGRYSVLSNFGMVPAAAMGVDLDRLFETTGEMVAACGPAAASNPGVELGCLLGTAAKGGRDKVSILASKGIADLGAWLEQLLAESTGKQGQALIPVDAEPVGPVSVYSRDRVFAYLRLEGHDEPELDALADALAEAGHPLVWIDLKRREDIGQEFFRWEVATAVAGAVMGLNPFDQPDVEASKVKARQLTDQYEATGRLEPETAFARGEGVAIYADPRNAQALQDLSGARTVEAYLEAHLRQVKDGDYVGLLAYIDRSHPHIQALQAIRARIRDRKKVATVLGFGPRFLHSTGQAYKGGPNSGVFLQIIHEPARDIPVPGQRYGFKVVEAAQARGDMGVLVERGRRVIRLDLGGDVEGGLKWLAGAVDKALG